MCRDSCFNAEAPRAGQDSAHRRQSPHQGGSSITAFGSPSKDKPRIDCDVDDNDHASKHELNVASQAGRIDDVEEVVLDKAFRVARLAGSDAKVALEIGERAVAASQFDPHRPSRGRKMNNWHPAPSRGKRATDQSKQDKGQVKHEDAVSGEAVEHECGAKMVDASRR